MEINLHVWLHNVPDPGLETVLARIDAKLDTITQKETEQMALGDDILAKIRAEKTTIDSVVVLIQSLKNQNVIPADVATAILAELDANKSELDVALQPAP